MSNRKHSGVLKSVYNQNVAPVQGKAAFEATPKFHCYDLYLIFKQFRDNNQYKDLIMFLVKNYPGHVKNKTFNFVNTGHLFHSLYAYIPALTGSERERKQIRLSVDCVHKLFDNTINPFKLYGELFDMINADQQLIGTCPCQLLLARREVIKNYVLLIKEKKFDTKPPKLKKDIIDNIMYKYSLNWKNILLKKKLNETNSKKKRKIKTRKIMTDESIYFIKSHHNTTDTFVTANKKYNTLNNNSLNAAAAAADADRLHPMSGMSLNLCKHEFVVVERQLRAGDEAVSFIRHCKRCGLVVERNG
ncbi:lef-5 [Leucania separata nucleopolyhedrovirus]|uniref:Lef-5 n=1 Tax=Leucania separata nucleopolyhedrovirus TaxID=1307956 RepID=Q0IL15_NPVLS|nr:lef-5 [Leucania separata nucleopolyhedrovirus]AAR28868.1 lef-5 [Leucania separata nucleopolyhedrovirus]